MILDYIKNNYQIGEPIFLEDLPCNSKDYLRQEMKKLVDEGKLDRFTNGVYFIPFKTFPNGGGLSITKYVNRKYIRGKDNKDKGILTGLSLLNRYGFTTQNPSVIEVCSNDATTKQRTINVEGFKVIVYKPIVEINNKNKGALEFLELMSVIDESSEFRGVKLMNKIKEYIKECNVDFNEVKEYLPYYPAKVYKNIYKVGLMKEII
mgnify:FL=1